MSRQIEPSHILYWKNNSWKTAKRNGRPRTFTTDEEVAEWYKHNRSRVDGLSVVKPIVDKKQKQLEFSDNERRRY